MEYNKEFYSIYGSYDALDWVKIDEIPRAFLVLTDLIPHAKYQFFRLVSNITDEVLFEVKNVERPKN